MDVSVSTTIDIYSQPYYAFNDVVNTLYVNSVPRGLSRYDIYEKVKELKGFQSLTFSEPSRRNNFSRHCWIEFENEDCTDQAEMQMSGLIINKMNLQVTKSTQRKKRIKVFKNYPTSRLSQDC